MPCCCKTNLEAASVIGKVFCCMGIFTIFEGFTSSNLQHIINGICNGALSGLLIFGAVKRNEIALLIWIILTSVGIVCLIYIILALILISINPHDDHDLNWIPKDFIETDRITLFLNIGIIVFIGATIFTIWTVIIVTKARKEIKQGVHLLPVVQLTEHNIQETEAKINVGPNIEPGHPSGPHPSAPHPDVINCGESPPPSYATALQASSYTD